MGDELVGIETSLSQSADVLVMCEQDDLSAAGQFGKSLQGGGGPVVIELDQDVIDHQGNWLVACEVGFQAGEAKGQVELIGRSLAQARDADRFRTARADCLQNGVILFIVIYLQALEGTESKPGEQTRGTVQDWTLAALSVAVDRLMQHHGGQPQPGVFLHLHRQAGLQFFRVLGGLGRARSSIHLLERLLLPPQCLVQLTASEIELGDLVGQRLKLIGQSIQVERQGCLAKHIERFVCTELLDLLVENLEPISELQRVS